MVQNSSSENELLDREIPLTACCKTGRLLQPEPLVNATAKITSLNRGFFTAYCVIYPSFTLKAHRHSLCRQLVALRGCLAVAVLQQDAKPQPGPLIPTSCESSQHPQPSAVMKCD